MLQWSFVTGQRSREFPNFSDTHLLKCEGVERQQGNISVNLPAKSLGMLFRDVFAHVTITELLSQPWRQGLAHVGQIACTYAFMRGDRRSSGERRRLRVQQIEICLPPREGEPTPRPF